MSRKSTSTSTGTIRLRLKFKPRWEGAVEGWAVNYATRNLWRVTPLYDIDDLLSDAALIFVTCRDRYPQAVDPPHFMSLFQRCFVNHVTDLSNRRSRSKQVHGVADDGDGRIVDLLDTLPSTHCEIDDAEVRLMLEQAPEKIQRIVHAMVGLSKKSAVVYKKRNRRRESNAERDERVQKAEECMSHQKIDGRRETTSERLCRIGRIEHDETLADQILAWIKGDKCTIASE